MLPFFLYNLLFGQFHLQALIPVKNRPSKSISAFILLVPIHTQLFDLVEVVVYPVTL